MNRQSSSPPPAQAPVRIDTGKSPDRATVLAEDRTSLALTRTFLAAERTLMAWVRTALSTIGFGFTMVQFFEYFADVRGRPVAGLFGRTWAPSSVGLTMIAIGTFALLGAVVQHGQMLKVLKAEGLAPTWSLALSVATLVAALGVFAFASVINGH